MEFDTHITRNIGLFGATGIGVGAIVGGGILALAGVAFSLAGPSAIIAFALNGVIALITVMSFAEMSAAFPESGGAYTFTKKVFSVRSAFAVGWILWFASIMAGVLYAMGFAFYAVDALKTLAHMIMGSAPAWCGDRWMVLLLSAGATAFYTIRLTRRVGEGGQWESMGKVILFCALILAGLFFLPRQAPELTSVKLSPFFGGGILGIVQAMGYTFITLQGFDLIAAVAGEVKDPARNIPRSMFLSLGIGLGIYLPFLFIISTVGVPAGQTIGALSRTHAETVIAVAVRNYLGPAGYWLIIVAALLSMLSALHANIMAASRIAFTMSRDRTLPRFLGSVSRQNGVPCRALMVSSLILVLSLIALSDLAAAGAAASLVFLISFALVHVTTILARVRGGMGEDTALQPPFPTVPLIGAVLCASLALFQALSDPSAGTIVGAWLTLGFILYFAILAGRAEVVDAMAEAQDPHLVRLRGRSPLVLIPLANPARASAMVEVANALSPSRVGRALLLFVVAGATKWESGQPPAQLLATQEALQEALTASFGSGLDPEALITVAPNPWVEIVRVARVHRCESMLIGLSDLSRDTLNPRLNDLVSSVDSDTVFLKSPADWQLSKVRSILVPVGGRGDHDELRARLLGSLCRTSEREVTFVRVVPEETTDKDMEWIRSTLTHFAGDEVPIEPRVQVIRSDNVVKGVRRHAAQSDLVILGIQRYGRRRKVFGEVALEIARVTPGATLIISRRG
ncbi:MAG: APC family permease [bacterium]